MIEMNTTLHIELVKMALSDELADYFELTKAKSTGSSVNLILKE